MTTRPRLVASGLVVLLAGCASLPAGDATPPPDDEREAAVTQHQPDAWTPGEDPVAWMHDRAAIGAPWADPPGTTTPWPAHLTPQHGDALTVDLAAQSWTVIDGGADNAVSTGFENLAPWGYLYLGLTVRSAGWAQLSDAERAAGGTVSVTMSPSQWAFAVHTLDQGLPYYSGDDLQQLRDARDAVTAAADASGVDLEPLAEELLDLSTTARPMDDAWDEALLAAYEEEQGR